MLFYRSRCIHSSNEFPADKVIKTKHLKTAAESGAHTAPVARREEAVVVVSIIYSRVCLSTAYTRNLYIHTFSEPSHSDTIPA